MQNITTIFSMKNKKKASLILFFHFNNFPTLVSSIHFAFNYFSPISIANVFSKKYTLPIFSKCITMKNCPIKQQNEYKNYLLNVNINFFEIILLK